MTIPDSVATIGEYAFHYCTSLRTVTIGDSVTTIGDWAFSSCRSLTSVTIPDSVTTIGNEAFYYCDSLTSVTIGDGVTTIGDEAFYYCDSLTSVTIGNGVTTIGDEAFENCTSLESVHITDVAAWCGIDFGYSDANPLYYGDLYLDGTLVTDLVIPDGVTSIGYYAFRYCDSLTTVTIPDSVTSIGESAFRYCDSLTDVYYTGTEEDHAFIKIGSSNTPLLNATWHYNSCIHVYDHACDVDCNLCGAIREVPGHVYDYVGDMDCNACGAIREEVSGTTGDCTWTLDADGHLTISGNGVMADYDSWDNPAPWDQFITAVTIEDGVTAIGEDAFYNCDSLTSVTIPDSVTTVGTYAFYNCDSLTSVTIPDSVITIGDCAFSSCRSLTSIEVDNNNPNYCSVDGVLFDKSQTLLIQYPGGKSGAYTIPDSVTTIGNAAFSYCISLTSVTIPDSVTTIGSFAFSVRSSLTDVYYSGTEEDRALIEIGFANDPLLNATWHYNYVPTPVCDHVYDDDTDPDCNACGDLRWAVSADIDFIISGADSGVALPAGTEVSVEQVAVGTVTPDLGDTAQIVTVYDITLTVNGVSIQPDGMMAVTLPIPTDAARYTDLQVVYIDDAGNVTPCETVVNKDGTITFYTDHFSYYAIVGTPAVLCGDANGDGTVNNRDVALLQQHINGWDVTLDETAADANGDGSVNNRDVALLQQYINGWDVTLGE